MLPIIIMKIEIEIRCYVMTWLRYMSTLQLVDACCSHSSCLLGKSQLSIPLLWKWMLKLDPTFLTLEKLSTIWHVSINLYGITGMNVGSSKIKTCSSSSKTFSREHRFDTWCDFLKNPLLMWHTQTTRDSNATYNLSNEPPAECKDPHFDCLIGLPCCITLKQRPLSKKKG